MTKIQLVTHKLSPAPTKTPHPRNAAVAVQQFNEKYSGEIYCWPSFFSPSAEPELLPSRSAAI